MGISQKLQSIFKALILSVYTVSIISPAQAMVLTGRLEENHEHTQADTTPSASPTFQQAPATSAAMPKPGASTLNPNTFPATYQGTWSCETTITESTIATVIPGTVVRSDIAFYPLGDGRIQARFSQPGWVDNQTMAVTFNGTEAKADRTSYYFGENSQGQWAARTRDQFRQDGPTVITAKSYVDQYMDGQYLGRYRSVSLLRKIGGAESVAAR
ncbi:MAG: hypothetical protein IPJ49_09110 [Candidatus Obscuribacter sp.]|nr:hypothetical protein [Candidatus Obscuribacter sp.]